MNSPENFAALLSPQEWRALREDIAFLRAWRRAEFITAYGTRIPIQASKENAVVDLRAITPTGAQVQPVVPSQAGHAGEVLVTDGANLAWASGARYFTHVTRNVVQSLTTNVETAISFDTVVENGGAWSASAPTRITVPAGGGGIWMISGGVGYSPADNNARWAYFFKNGVLMPFPMLSYPTISANNIMTAISTPIRLVAGDYLELMAYQDSGGSVNTLAGRPAMVACRIGV